LTQGEEDKSRRGYVAAKGATVIFWRLVGGDEEELLALRFLRLDLVAIFFGEAKNGQHVPVCPENKKQGFRLRQTLFFNINPNANSKPN